MSGEHKRLCSLGLEGMTVVLTLDERMVVVGLADNVVMAVAEDDLKVVTPDGSRLTEISTNANGFMQVPVSVTALTCVKHFNLCQLESAIQCHVDPEVHPTCNGCEVHHNLPITTTVFTDIN